MNHPPSGARPAKRDAKKASPHDRHREQEHHHAAVHGEDLVVRVGTHQRVAWDRKLRADDQPEDAAEHEEQERGPEVEQPDARVVHVGDRSPASGRLPHRLQASQLVGGAGKRIGTAHRRLAR
jgi:hypothetical protein